MLCTIARQKAKAPYGGKVLNIELPAGSADSWLGGLRTGAPDTGHRKFEWKAEKYFLPDEDPAENSRLVLMWAGGEAMTSVDAARWGRANGLRMTHPLEIFALSAAFPCLYWGFGLKGVGLVPTQFGQYYRKPHICSVWQSMKRGTREAKLCPADAALYDRTIFVFGEY